MSEGRLLVCWHSERAGVEVVTNTLTALRNKRLGPDRILYLVQGGRPRSLPGEILGAPLEMLVLRLDDPTRHGAVYEAVLRDVCPRLGGEVHINVSPGTPAMHAVWLVLHAGGALPAGARLWSSQWNPETKRTRLDPVDFAVTTYLAEVRRRAGAQPDVAAYETEARSPARRAALERLARYARVIGAPLLILGERGTGKTRLVETHVSPLKQRPKVVLRCVAHRARRDLRRAGHRRAVRRGRTAPGDTDGRHAAPQAQRPRGLLGATHPACLRRPEHQSSRGGIRPAGRVN